MDITITLRNPATDLPPLNRDILAVVESSIDRGRGFKRHHDLRVLRILAQDADGDEDEGAAIYGELQRGECGWDNVQLMLQAGIDEIDDFYSDSIVWWAEMPAIPMPPGQDGSE
jgi:hypothetical protein